MMPGTIDMAALRLAGLRAATEVDPETTPLSDLVTLKPTTELRATLSDREEATGDQDDIAVKAARRLVRMAERRDRIQADRLAGCWCLGTGGRGERTVGFRFALPNGELSTALVPEEVTTGFAVYCRCPDGERVHRAMTAAVDAYKQQQIQEYQTRWWRRTGLPAYTDGLTIESYPVSEGTAAAVAKLRAWLDLPDDPWLYLHGRTGAGKTVLAAILARALVAHGATLVFMDVPDLLGTIRETWDRTGARDADDDHVISERSLHRSLMDADLLVLDDLGADAGYAWEVERLFRVINGRYNAMKRTIITSNLTPGELARHFGAQGERQVWRIMERAQCSVIHLEGANLRDQEPVDRRVSLRLVGGRSDIHLKGGRAVGGAS